MFHLVKARLLQLVFVLFLVSLLTFVLMKLAPGDPVKLLLQADQVAVTKADEAALRKELGFDRPLLAQYGEWLLNLLKLDLGYSYVKKKPVVDELIERLPVTFQLTMGGLIVMMLIAVPLGLLAAKYQSRLPDHLCRLFALLGASMPIFWTGLLLVYVFAVKLEWLPSMGMGSFRHLILPSVTLGFGFAAVQARLLRASLLESMSQEYIRAAQARGINEWRIVSIHALRAALLPFLTAFGMTFGTLLTGAVVVEILFSWPGLGSMVIEAIFQRDYPIIQGYALLTSVFIVVVNLLVDLAYGLLDPRIRYGKGGVS